MNKISQIITSLFLASAVSTSAMAADIEAGVVKHVPAAVEMPSFFSEYPLDLSALPHRDSQKHSKIIDGPSAAAKGISYFEIQAVGSSNVGWEILQDLQPTTSYNHGGQELYIVVRQVGYGNANNATMNGISRSAFRTEYLCGSNLHVCNAGETIIGFRYYFNYSGQSAGQFVSSANSVASPYGYWSDSVYIY